MDKWETVGAGGKKSSKAHGQNKGGRIRMALAPITRSKLLS